MNFEHPSEEKMSSPEKGPEEDIKERHLDWLGATVKRIVARHPNLAGWGVGAAGLGLAIAAGEANPMIGGVTGLATAFGIMKGMEWVQKTERESIKKHGDNL